MASYPGAVPPEVWAEHADAGCITWTAGTAPQWTAFVEKFPAVRFAADNGADLFIWHGRTGHQAEVPDLEKEPEIG